MQALEGLELRETRLRLPGLPGVLRLRRPPSVDALLERVDPLLPDAEARIPYWAEIWPSALALALGLLAGLGPRRPGSSLELGCGLGVAGLVALRLGWSLELADRDPQACALARLNLAHNGFDPGGVRQLDWNQSPPSQWSTILGADLLYERGFAEPLAAWLSAALAPRGRVFLVEPGRDIARPCIERLAQDFALRTSPLRARVDGRWRPLRLLTLWRREEA